MGWIRLRHRGPGGQVRSRAARRVSTPGMGRPRSRRSAVSPRFASDRIEVLRDAGVASHHSDQEVGWRAGRPHLKRDQRRGASKVSPGALDSDGRIARRDQRSGVRVRRLDRRELRAEGEHLRSAVVAPASAGEGSVHRGRNANRHRRGRGRDRCACGARSDDHGDGQCHESQRSTAQGAPHYETTKSGVARLVGRTRAARPDHIRRQRRSHRY